MEKVKIEHRDSYYRTPQQGYSLGFGTETITIPQGESFTCRERLHGHWTQNQNKKLIFRCGENKQNKVEKLIRWVENKLKVKNGIKFFTNGGALIVLEISKWWNTPMRKHFLSGLLRAVKHFNEKNFLTAILKYRYFKQTKYAVRRFLSGMVNFRKRKRLGIYRFTGWQNTFGWIPNSEIDKMMVR